MTNVYFLQTGRQNTRTDEQAKNYMPQSFDAGVHFQKDKECNLDCNRANPISKRYASKTVHLLSQFYMHIHQDQQLVKPRQAPVFPPDKQESQASYVT
jgi:hypothetical protein